MRSPSTWAWLIAAALVLAACTTGSAATPAASGATSGSSPDAAASSDPGAASVLPVIITSEQVVGENRILFSFVDPTSLRPVATPDRTALVRFWPDAKGEAEAVSGAGRFLWAIPDVTGVYVTTVDFAEAGPWTAEFTTAVPGEPDEVVRFGFDVKETGFAKRPGDQAPSVVTPTLADVGGDAHRISTDTAPDARFYETSVDEALAQGEPFVLVFATPLLCTSSMCGPLLEQTKAVAATHPDVTVINVEPYQLAWTDGRLQPVLDADGQLQPVEAVEAYGILSEPWIYVVEGDGTIATYFEGVVAEDELAAAFESIQ